MNYLEYEDNLQHHGVKGMKWGVRRYQNADGSLTPAGKKRQARIDASDERYKQKQIAKTTKYYDKNRRTGPYGLNKVEGIKSLEKKLNSQDGKWDKNVIKGQIAARKALRNMELKTISSMTHDQIQKEKIETGKQVVKDLLTSTAVSAITIPTTGLMYIHTSDLQGNRSRSRLVKD